MKGLRMRIEFWIFDFSPRLRDPLTRGFLKENANDLRSAHGDRGVRFGGAHVQTLLSTLIRA